MSDHVLVKRDGAVLEVELNRPEKRNALTLAMYDALPDALTTAENDPSVAAVVLSGAGKSFCAGNDLADFITSPPVGEDSPVARFLTRLASASVPIVAAVQGNCVGVGATMLLHCDHVIAEANTKILFRFVDLALVPEAASSLLLPRAVGPRLASDLLLLGDTLGAEDAKMHGFVNRTVGDGEGIAAARDVAGRLATKAPTAAFMQRSGSASKA